MSGPAEAVSQTHTEDKMEDLLQYRRQLGSGLREMYKLVEDPNCDAGTRQNMKAKALTLARLLMKETLSPVVKRGVDALFQVLTTPEIVKS